MSSRLMETILDKYSSDIQQLCKRYGVKNLYAFGSVLTTSYNSKSDIDLIVDFEPIDVLQYADNYYNFKYSLEAILNKPVDLLEEKAIQNPYFKQAVNSQRQLLYGH